MLCHPNGDEGNSQIVGQARVLAVWHAPALFPRITFRLGVTLHERPADHFTTGRPIQNYEMRDLAGELRLEEISHVVGSLQWAGPRRNVRSAPYASENQIDLVCDLDWSRLERIEERRAGGEAKFFVVLWPSLADGTGSLDCDAPAFRADIPRDQWLALLGQLGHVRRTVVEVAHVDVPAPEFDKALGHLNEASARVSRGDYDEAVASCRRAVESLCAALDVPNKAGALEAALEAATDERRAKAYAGIVSKLKELGNVTIHRAEAPPRFTRGEALFVVGSTQQVAGLLASVLHR